MTKVMYRYPLPFSNAARRNACINEVTVKVGSKYYTEAESGRRYSKETLKDENGNTFYREHGEYCADYELYETQKAVNERQERDSALRDIRNNFMYHISDAPLSKIRKIKKIMEE